MLVTPEILGLILVAGLVACIGVVELMPTSTFNKLVDKIL